MPGPGYVYIMASRRNGTIYLGVTNDLVRRVWEHRTAMSPGFTKEHGCTTLVWFETHEDIQSARVREVQMKRWKRGWKLREIEGANPDWDDLFEAIAGRRETIPTGLLPSQEHKETK